MGDARDLVTIREAAAAKHDSKAKKQQQAFEAAICSLAQLLRA